MRHQRGLAGLVLMVMAGLSLAVPGGPASAAPGGDMTTFSRSSWTYVDSRTPKAAYPDPSGDVPVGRVRDADGSHVHRSFVTFDLTRFAGRRIDDVIVFGPETRATNCTRRSVELWETAATTSTTTWKRQPDWQRKLSTAGPIPNTTCPFPRVQWDATAAVRDAVAAGRASVTLGLRNTDENRADQGRWFGNGLQMTVAHNGTPDTPDRTSTQDLPCAGEAPGTLLRTLTPTLRARVSDPDGGSLDTTFAIWPLTDPARRTELTVPGPSGSLSVLPVRTGLVADGGGYGWSARAVDQGGLTSGWSSPCYFEVDATAPGTTPVISSADYPSDGRAHGGVGIAGRFTFDAKGDTEVTGFTYGWSGGAATVIDLDRPGGTATVSIVPTRFTSILEARTFDRAGNQSRPTWYQFSATPTEPRLVATGRPRAGQPFPIRFEPGITLPGHEVTSYSWALDSGEQHTVPAGPDGTATATVTPEYGPVRVLVRSRSANGWVSPEGVGYWYADNSPTVTSADFPEDAEGGPAGRPGSFTLSAGLPGSTTIFVSFDDGATWQERPLDANNEATIAWTPPAAGTRYLLAYSQTADGTRSDWNWYGFTVTAG